MAYIPKDDSQQQSGSTMQVYGSGQQQGESAQDMGSTSTTDTSGMSTGASAISPQGSQQPKQGGIKMGPMNQQSPGPKPTPAPRQKASSGMFSNIRKYVQANQPKAQQMGQNVKQQFQKQVGGVRGQFQQQQSQFQQKVDENRKRLEQARQFGQEQIDQAANATAQPPLSRPLPREWDPTKITTKPVRPSKEFEEQIKKQREYENSTWRADDKFMEEYNSIINRLLPMDHGPGSSNERANKSQQEDLKKLFAQYGYSQNMPASPQQDNVGRFQQLTSDQGQFDKITGGLDVLKQQVDAADLSQYAKSLEGGSGLSRLLKDTYAKGYDPYSGGMRGLDQLILGSRADIKGDIASTAKAATESLTGDIKGAKRAALQDLTNLQLGGTQLAKDLKEKLSGAQSGLEQVLADRISSGEGTFTREVLNALEEGGMDSLSDEQLQALGLSRDQNLYGTKLQEFLTYDPSKYSFSDVATQDDLARARALAELAGQDQSLISDPSKIGKTMTDDEAANLSAFNAKLAANKKAHDDEVARQKAIGYEPQYDSAGNIAGWVVNPVYMASYKAAQEAKRAAERAAREVKRFFRRIF